MALAVTGYTENNWITKKGPIGYIRQHSGLLLPYYNPSATLAFLAGEPIVYNGMVCVSSKLILPSKMGEVYTNWLCDFMLDPAHTGDILANATLWWSYDVDAITGNEGAVVASAPTNGFILGRAVAKPEDPVDGSNKKKVAGTGSVWVRVASIQEPYTAIGTIPVTFN